MSTPVATTSKEKDDSEAMPPPPVPESKSSRPKILQPEFDALASCLRDAIVKTGQIAKFHAETRKLGLENQVATPPSSLTAGLGRDIERYDQLCDSIEAQIVRAINVLKRDLRREERRREEEELRKLAEASSLPPAEPMVEDVAARSLPEGESTSVKLSPTINTSNLGRRPSAISISSLHRPQFPLKLDLSSTSLKFSEEDAMKYQKGLASPVTLAPKSARPVGPNEYPPDFMAAFTTGPLPSDMAGGSSTIDLTIPETNQLSHHPSQIGLRLVGSSDKPIDLEAMTDVEMASVTDLFGDTAESSEGNNETDGLFSPTPSATTDQAQKDQQRNPTDFNMDANVNAELFGDFSNTQQSSSTFDSLNTSSNPSALSADTLMAQLSSVDAKPSLSNNLSGQGFDLGAIDLTSDFFNDSQNSQMAFPDMDTFLDMDPGPSIKKEEDA